MSSNGASADSTMRDAGAQRPQVLSETRMANSFLGNLIEICIVTSDHRRAMEGLVRLGIGPWRVYIF